MVRLPGKDTSLWLDTTPSTRYPALPAKAALPAGRQARFDVVVVGGGMAGLLTACFLQDAGFKTAVIEKDRIVQNTTGNTTAKLTSQHNLIYADLIKRHGRPVAQAYATTNEQATKNLWAFSRSLGIEADFESAPAYVYTQHTKHLPAIKREVRAAQGLALPASFETKTDLPFAVKGAIKFSSQTQFHPRKFLLAVAKNFVKHGGKIYEQTEASDIKPGDQPTLITNRGKLSARQIVVASKYPFWRRSIFDKAAWVKLSYGLGVLLANDAYPRGMYITPAKPIRTIRSHPYKGGRILIFGGESHELTKDYNKDEHYQNLIDDVQRKFKVKKIVYRWVAGDMIPHDRLPYIGLYPGQRNIYVITGFHAWGLGWAMIAAKMIRDQALGRSNKLADMVSPDRLKA